MLIGYIRHQGTPRQKLKAGAWREELKQRPQGCAAHRLAFHS